MLSLKTLLVSVMTGVASGLRFTNANYDHITVGSPFNITWEDASGPVQVTLLSGGTPNYVQTVGVLAENITTDYYVWTPLNVLPTNTYVVKFEDASGAIVHGFPFQLLGAAATPITASPTAAAAATSTTYATTWTYP